MWGHSGAGSPDGNTVLVALLGARADMNFEFSSCRFLLSLWGRNLTNTKYNVFGFPINTPTSPHFAQKGNGIQVGVDVNLHF